jgi:hypothetical protein
MKKLLTIVMAGLLLAAFAVPAFAWEFEMKGEYENRVRYFGRTGGTDLFGHVAMQETTLGLGGASTWIGFAGPNIYNRGATGATVSDSSNILAGGSGMVITRGGFSRWGSDALYNDSRLTIHPYIRVNPAIRVHGVYTIGGMRNKYFQASDTASIGAAPVERYYMSQTSMNAYDGTFGTWEQFRATITMPWAIWSIGLKDFPLGTGATLAENTRAESMLWVVPYGPFRLLGAVWLGRSRHVESWATIPDGEHKNEWFNGLIITYDAGEFSCGIGEIWRHDHRGYAAGAGGVAQQQARDDSTFIGIGYFKFNNGRFFANGEYAWVNIDRYFPYANGNNGSAQMVDPLALVKAAGVTNDLGGAPLYLEGYHLFTEFGMMAGPTKLSLMYALASGNVLPADRQIATHWLIPANSGFNYTKRYVPFAINYQATEPYEFLMFNTYAGGNNGGWNPNSRSAATGVTSVDVSFTYDEHGQMTDAYCFAGRLDYAVAANLNVFGSYIWAHRLERQGTYAGQFNETGSAVLMGGPLNGGNNFMTQYGGTTPFVPDGFIGWEVNAGADWKLLEGMTFKARYSYWQPGEWFNYAYQAFGTLPNGTVGVPSAIVKDRSAINAFQASVLITF